MNYDKSNNNNYITIINNANVKGKNFDSSIFVLLFIVIAKIIFFFELNIDSLKIQHNKIHIIIILLFNIGTENKNNIFSFSTYFRKFYSNNDICYCYFILANLFLIINNEKYEQYGYKNIIKCSSKITEIY